MELVFPLESPSVAYPFRNLPYQEILARGGEWLADRNWNFLSGPHPTISQLLQTGGSVLYHLSNLPLPCPPGHQPHLAVSLLYCTTGRKFTTSLGARNGTGFTFTDGGSQPKEPQPRVSGPGFCHCHHTVSISFSASRTLFFLQNLVKLQFTSSN